MSSLITRTEGSANIQYKVEEQVSASDPDLVLPEGVNPLDYFFGLWKDKNISLEQIRKEQWER